MQIPWQQQPENKSKIGGSVRYHYSNRRTLFTQRRDLLKGEKQRFSSQIIVIDKLNK